MPALTAPVVQQITAPLASPASLSYARNLIAQRVWTGLTASELATAQKIAEGGTPTQRDCSRLIDRLKKAAYQPRETQATTPAPARTKADEGFYMYEGQYVKVQANKSGTGSYAKVWEGGSWVYTPGLVYRLNETMKLTAEQAKQFGDDTHRCIYCSIALTDQRSIDAGYGPVCADNYGLPWGN